jgi:hypothetical protein
VSIKQLLPVTLAFFSEQRDLAKDESGITVVRRRRCPAPAAADRRGQDDVIRDTLELIKSPEIDSTLQAVANGRKLTVLLEGAAGRRMTQVLEYIYHVRGRPSRAPVSPLTRPPQDVLLLCNGPVLQAGRRQIQAADAVAVILTNPSLADLLSRTLQREAQRPPLNNAIPLALRQGYLSPRSPTSVRLLPLPPMRCAGAERTRLAAVVR